MTSQYSGIQHVDESPLIGSLLYFGSAAASVVKVTPENRLCTQFDPVFAFHGVNLKDISPS